jgi:hypothetical protein
MPTLHETIQARIQHYGGRIKLAADIEAEFWQGRLPIMPDHRYVTSVTRNGYTEAQDIVLRDNYGTLPLKQIGYLIGRTENSVYYRCLALGIYKGRCL